MWICKDWQDYKVLDLSDGEKLEDWKGYRLIRPDPQIVWKKKEFPELWKTAHGWYHRSGKGGGSWEFIRQLPESWYVEYAPLGLRFQIKPMGFKHTGLFPEQAANWQWFSELIQRAGRPISILNLFAYTGGATAAAAAAGAAVTHIDSSRGMVTWAKENLKLSGLAERPVRTIVDDVIKFVERELRRGRKYDAVIMDPPSYGRGPNGEVWKLEDELFSLTEKCVRLLSEQPLFFLINSYTTGLAPSVLYDLLEMTVAARFGGSASADELGLPVKNSALVLPCGASGRWQR